MHYMKAWVGSMQDALDKAIGEKQIDPITGRKLTNKSLDFEAALGRRLLCSYGREYNCSARVSEK